ncbi:MAG: SDR family NAD(P)-dependent oxidoreductase [Betaproteobacteria bacterium]
MKIDGGVFLVTGAASGLGAASARMLVANGARVVLADVREPEGQAFAAELGASATFCRTDVTDEGSASAAVAVAATHGELRGLISCAGIVHGERIVKRDGAHSLDAFARVIGVNLIGAFTIMRLSCAAMAKNVPGAGGERGVVVHTASVAAYDGQIGQAAYASSKAGLVGLTLPAARELAGLGIRVMTIAPGIFSTPMMANLAPDVQAALGRMVPFPPRLGRPDEYASLVRTIVESEYLNGEVIRLDGAIRLAPK